MQLCGLRERGKRLTRGVGRTGALVVLSALLLCTQAGPTWAQAPGPEAAAEVEPVVRGAFAEMEAGLTVFLMDIADRPQKYGFGAGFFVGYDITPWLALMVGANAVAVAGTNLGDGPKGDLFILNPMLQLQVALFTTPRDFVWIRAGGGGTFSFPQTLGGEDFGGIGASFAGAVGYERYLMLRHFSLGIRVGALGITAPDFAVAVTAMPTLKYTF